MASMVARALVEDVVPAQAGNDGRRRGIDRVLLATFWRPSQRTAMAAVVPISANRSTTPGQKPR
jgi:hypothetical protein